LQIGQKGKEHFKEESTVKRDTVKKSLEKGVKSLTV